MGAKHTLCVIMYFFQELLFYISLYFIINVFYREILVK